MSLNRLVSKLAPYVAVGMLALASGCTLEYQPNYDPLTKFNSASEDTVGHEYLYQESDLSFGAYSVLEEIIDEAKIRLQPKINPYHNYNKEEAVEILETIAQLLKDKGFKYKENLLLSEGLKTKGIDCDNYSIIYISIAESLGLPLTGVIVPGHMFVRWNFDHQNYFNWEITSNDTNKERDDQYYVENFKISSEDIENGTYLNNLSREELIAVLFFQLGIRNYENNDYDLALAYLEDAVRLYPNMKSAHEKIKEVKLAKEQANN